MPLSLPIQRQIVQRLLGYLLSAFSFSMLPPLVLSIVWQDGETFTFLYAFFLLFTCGTALWIQASHGLSRAASLRLRDGFAVVAASWIVLGLAGAIPLYLSPALQLSVTDAAFEAISGLTTTGATVLTGLDELPASLLLYRQMLQWIGGLGIIILAVAVLPMVGMGGMQLYHANAPHSLSDRRVTPRIAKTSKNLLVLYVVLTGACALAYWIAGMSGFDAVGHAMSTVSIGGFSTHDANFGYFDSALIEAVAITFMFVAGINFSLHYASVVREQLDARRRLRLKLQFNLGIYAQDGELRGYITILLLTALACIGYLWLSGYQEEPDAMIRQGLFQTVSIATTTGFTTSGYNHWPIFVSTLLLLSSFIGGCIGSTAGGMKVIRFLIMFKQGGKELQQLIHPTAHFTLRIGQRIMPPMAIQAAWGFFAAYISLFAVFLLLLMATGLDQVTAFSAVAASLNNLGPGLGEVSQSYSSVSDFGKWLLCVSMLFGRMEVFTLLVMLTPAFWRR